MTVSWNDASDPSGYATIEFIAERDGQRDVTGAMWLPSEPQPERPLVLFGHGAAGDRYETPISEMARHFVDDVGCPVLSIDGPIHGLRVTEPGGDAALMAELSRPSVLEEMTDDWNFAIELAHGHEAVGEVPLAYFGLSLGSVFGIPLLGERDDVLVATLGLIGSRTAFTQLNTAFLAAAENITCPLFYIVQLEDELFSREGCFELFDAIASEDKRMHANPGLHPDVPPDEVFFAYDFMKSHIVGTARARTSG